MLGDSYVRTASWCMCILGRQTQEGLSDPQRVGHRAPE